MEEVNHERSPSIVDQPIINSPFKEPEEHWLFEEGLPRREKGRRQAGYWRTRRERATKIAVTAEEFVSLDQVIKIRKRVDEWKKNGYRGVSKITFELLKQWNSTTRSRRLFFCQMEAIETLIWLIEAPASQKQGIEFPEDRPNDPISLEKGYNGLKRYCCKMATGSGKTVVMAMIIAWSILNKIYNKKDKRFSDSVLVVCPNLTVKERLSVLKPSNPDNYYEKFELVPPSLIPVLTKGKIMITNWHLFISENDESNRSVVKRGLESDNSFSKRTLTEIQSKTNILVINDEAHHAYRPAQKIDSSQKELFDLPTEKEYIEQKSGLMV